MKLSIQKFTKEIKESTKLIVPSIGNKYIPKNIWFPKARYLTVIDWNSNALYNNLNDKIFPNVEHINLIYSNKLNIPSRDVSEISTRFIDNINFKWGVYEDIAYNKNIVNMRNEYIIKIYFEQYMNYVITGTDINYRRLWQEYMNNKRRELL